MTSPALCVKCNQPLSNSKGRCQRCGAAQPAFVSAAPALAYADSYAQAEPAPGLPNTIRAFLLLGLVVVLFGAGGAAFLYRRHLHSPNSAQAAATSAPTQPIPADTPTLTALQLHSEAAKYDGKIVRLHDTIVDRNARILRAYENNVGSFTSFWRRGEDKLRIAVSSREYIEDMNKYYDADMRKKTDKISVFVAPIPIGLDVNDVAEFAGRYNAEENTLTLIEARKVGVAPDAARP